MCDFFDYKIKNNNTMISIARDLKVIQFFNGIDAKMDEKSNRWVIPNEKYPDVEAHLIELGYIPNKDPIDIHIIKLNNVCEAITEKDPEVIAAIKSCEGYKWIPERMRWSIPIDKLDHLTFILECVGKEIKIHEGEDDETLILSESEIFRVHGITEQEFVEIYSSIINRIKVYEDMQKQHVDESYNMMEHGRNNRNQDYRAFYCRIVEDPGMEEYCKIYTDMNMYLKKLDKAHKNMQLTGYIYGIKLE